jgi:hypothetical protein
MSFPGFSKPQIVRENIFFYYHVYRGDWPWTTIARKVLLMAVATYPWLRPLRVLLPLGVRVKRSVLGAGRMFGMRMTRA